MISVVNHVGVQEIKRKESNRYLTDCLCKIVFSASSLRDELEGQEFTGRSVDWDCFAFKDYSMSFHVLLQKLLNIGELVGDILESSGEECDLLAGDMSLDSHSVVLVLGCTFTVHLGEDRVRVRKPFGEHWSYRSPNCNREGLDCFYSSRS